MVLGERWTVMGIYILALMAYSSTNKVKINMILENVIFKQSYYGYSSINNTNNIYCNVLAAHSGFAQLTIDIYPKI